MKNVLSLFDGCSGGQLALNHIGIKYEKYFASEIDKYAMQVTENNFPNTVQLGTILDWQQWQFDWSKIDLVIAGFPCQAWSIAGKQQGDKDDRGKLFWVMLDVLKHVKKHNPNFKFIIENVKMKKDFEQYITSNIENAMGDIHKTLINSALVSAQNRNRYYWTNFPITELPVDRGILLKDIIEDHIDDKYYLSDKMLEYIENRKEKNRNLKRGFSSTIVDDLNVKASCITAGYGKYQDNGETYLKHVANVDISGHDILKRVYSIEGKSPTLCAHTGGNTEPKILCNINPSGQGMNGNVYNTNTKSPTLTTNKGEGIKILASGFNQGDDFDHKSPTLSCNSFEQNNYLQDGYRVRKLTPQECERLQTFPDNYTAGVSNSQRYKILGNSFTVDVIAHILKNLNI